MTAQELNMEAHKLISNDEFNNFLVSHAKKMRQIYNNEPVERIDVDLIFLEPKGYFDNSYPVTMMAIRTEFGDNRYALMHELGRKTRINRSQPIAAFLLFEGWAKTMTPEEAKLQDIKRPSSYADRREIGVLAGMTIDGRVNMAIMEIERVDDKIKLSDPNILSYNPLALEQQRNDLVAEFFRGYFSEALQQMQQNN